MKKSILIPSIIIAILFVSFLSTITGQRQEIILKGIVLDEEQQPIEYATVQILGTQKTAFTDSTGQFTIQSTKNCTQVSIKRTGFKTIPKIRICASTDNTITLSLLTIEEEILFEVEEEAMESRPKKLFQRSKSEVMADQMISPTAYDPYAPTMKANPLDNFTNYNTEDYGIINENRFLRSTDNPLSTFSIDVDASSYSNLRRFLNNGQKPPKDAIRIEEMINYFNYDHPQPTADAPFSSTMEMAECPWAPQHQLLQISLQGKRISTENLPASNMVFLIDVSGSMSSPNKLPLLKSSFKLLTDQLRARDKVAIVVYAGAAGVVLEPTSGDKKREIKAALDRLEAGGSTAGEAGIKMAYQLAKEHFIEGGNNRVILATDGDFNVGLSSDAGLVRLIEQERESGVFLTVLGFGMGNYKDNKMQELSSKGNGNHAYIDNISEARKVLLSEFGGTMFAIAKDVKLQVEFNPAKVAGYRLIGYENRMLKTEDFKDDKKDAGELGSGHTVTALYEIIPAGLKSTFLADKNDLKYQKNQGSWNNSKEWVSLKLRYKDPEGKESKLLTDVFKGKSQGFENASENLRWAVTVAQFGLLLRNSPFKQEATYRKTIEMAKAALGEDQEGYRLECLKMIIAANDLFQPTTAEK